MNATNRINDLLNKKDWTGARRIIFSELKEKPNKHWLLDQLASTYYEEKNYRQAKEILEQALTVMPTCPLVLWDYAGTLDMLGQRQKAMRIYKKLLRTSDQKYDECWESKEWATSLKTDCKYRLGCYYRGLGKLTTAFGYFESYFADLEKGVDSIYKENIKYDIVNQSEARACSWGQSPNIGERDSRFTFESALAS